MKKQLTKFAQAAGIMLAMVFTFNCSSGEYKEGDGGGNNNGGGDGEQLYIYADNSLFTGSGVIRLKNSSINIGSVTNGKVTINLPATGLDDYDYFYPFDFCSLPSNMKVNYLTFDDGHFQLISNTGENLGWLRFRYSDEQIKEEMFYLYSTKAGKITCNYDGDKNIIIDINAKENDWSKVYVIRSTTPNKWSTDNILTQQLKWTLH